MGTSDFAISTTGAKNVILALMKIYLATGNENKRREIAQLFPDCQIILPRDERIAFAPEETGETFLENSFIKARALWQVVKSPVLADDSGICCDALGGAPGVFSSRYAGPLFMRGRDDGITITQQEQNDLLVSQVTAAKGTRAARYVCSMVLLLGRDRFVCAQETMEGKIVGRIEDARGTGGFGYDPIFLLPNLGKTAAELSAEEKNAISHRGKASRLLKRLAREVFATESRTNEQLIAFAAAEANTIEGADV